MYDAVILAPAAMLLFAKEVPSPTTDLAPAALTIVVFGEWLRAVAGGDKGGVPCGFRLRAALFLCATAVTAKLSAGMVLGLAAVFILVRLVLRVHRGPDKEPVRLLIVAVGLSVLTCGVLLARNVILSGYPLYPSTALSAPVEWLVPADRVEPLAHSIATHGKGGMPTWVAQVLSDTSLRFYADFIGALPNGRDDVAGLNWVRAWFLASPLFALVEVVLPLLAGAGLSAMLLRRVGFKAGPIRKMGLLFGPMLVGLVCWFLISPDPRFIYGLTWSFAAMAAALLWTMSPRGEAGGGVVDPRPMFVLMMVFLVVVTVTYRAGVQIVLREANPLQRIPFQGPGPEGGFHPTPTGRLVRWRSSWGFQFMVNKPWYHPQPAVGWPGPDPDVRLREPGEMQKGFVIDRSPHAGSAGVVR